eukprot:NODE_12_length_45166_cov_0.552511.p3 type:complete len:789 gc:universal NODE_12_length_45166_cov_0.552511:37145-34779(-)
MSNPSIINNSKNSLDMEIPIQRVSTKNFATYKESDSSDSDDEIIFRRKSSKSRKKSSKSGKTPNIEYRNEFGSNSAANDESPKRNKFKLESNLSDEFQNNTDISTRESKPLKSRKSKKTVDMESDDTSIKTSKKGVTRRLKKASKSTEESSSVSRKRAESGSAGNKTNKRVKKEPDVESDGMDIDQLLEEDGDVKWQTLEHQGVYFPPEYIPHGIPLIYAGNKVSLKPLSEEIATFFAGVIGTDYESNPVFCANFFSDFKSVCKQDGHDVIKSFSECDFTQIYDYLEELKIQRKSMSKEEKLAIKQEKLEIEKKYGYAIINGRKEKIGNFRLEPPGLFRGRGKHPKTGKLKKRLMPGDVVINISKGAPVPKNPYNLPWKEVVHNPNVTWLAMWKENINGNFKYVFLSHGSLWKSMSDLKKFEKSRELSKIINSIRKTYTMHLKSNDEEIMQRATALYFIDELALRAGNEKGDDEADTVGCCSLRVEHVDFKDPDCIVFDFLGKDSIRYYNEVTVPLVIYQNVKHLTLNKSANDDLFDKLTTTSLNKHLQGLMPGLTAKVFRTFNASFTFANELQNTPKDASINEKILAYNRSNRQVAILCNHQKSVSKGHDGLMKKMNNKLLGYCLEQVEIQGILKDRKLDINKELQEKLTSEWIQEHLELNKELLAKKLVAQYEKHVEKCKETEKEFLAFEEFKISKTPKAKIEKTEEQLLKEFDRLKEKIEKTQTTLLDKDEGKTTALGTSKLNYIDPRITVAWCKKYDVPIEKMMNKSLKEKFKWALAVTSEWKY